MVDADEGLRAALSDAKAHRDSGTMCRMPIDAIDSSVCTLLSKIVSALVDQPEEVRITPTPQSEGVCFRVAVHRDDVGKLIGKQGRTARSLRIILSAIGMKVRRRYSLDIVEG